MDGIAGLFERDARGRFLQLTAYYERIGWIEADEEALVAATRRLVFSQVNDRLFACYGEVDASLSHLII